MAYTDIPTPYWKMDPDKSVGGSTGNGDPSPSEDDPWTAARPKETGGSDATQPECAGAWEYSRDKSVGGDS